MSHKAGDQLFAWRCDVRRLHVFIASTALLVIGINATAQVTRQEKEPERPAAAGDEKLRQELLQRMRKDQFARNKLVKRKADRANVEEIIKVDRENTAWLKDVVDRHGWPGKALVGKDGAGAAWLLVQHADRDPVFQKKCLGLLTIAVKRNDASPQHMAYLVDRVRIAEKKPQVYGTQLVEVDGKLVPKPIDDAEHVDGRREEMGLPPLSDYLKDAATALLPIKDEP